MKSKPVTLIWVGKRRGGTSCEPAALLQMCTSGGGEAAERSEWRGDEIRHGMEELARLTLTKEGNRDHVKHDIGCARDS